jgi:hypothetical protein
MRSNPAAASRPARLTQMRLASFTASPGDGT